MKKIASSIGSYHARSRHATFVMALLAAVTFLLLGGINQAQAQWTTTGADTTNASGNVGIGTSAPTTKLSLTDGATPYPAATGALLDLKTSSANGNDTTSRAGLRLLNGSNGFSIYYGGTSDRLRFLDGGDAERLSILNGGNIGIGTISPSARLHIAGDNTATGGYPIIKLQNNQTGGHSWWLYAGALGTAGALGIYDETAGGYRMFFDAVGNIGVGTSSPVTGVAGTYSSTLQLQGTNPALIVRNGSSGNFLGLRAVAGGTKATLFVDNGITQSDTLTWDSSGNVGIGTSTPNSLYKLDVQGGPLNASGGLCIAGVCKSSWSQVGGGSSLWSDNGTSISYSSGGVGIGAVPASQYKLDVTGDTHVTGALSATGAITGGTINATYQDVAEWVPSTHTLAAGTVVVLNPEKSNEVMASTSAYDTRVAGVVSERPGLSLGEAGTGKALVATTGRVKVLVDATRSPIHVGDLLVTSDEEGVAMKSEPVEIGGVKLHRPGTLIGKALEPLARGRGRILVLLSLQ